MDPNQFNPNFWMNFMQNYQPPNTQNSPNPPYPPNFPNPPNFSNPPNFPNPMFPFPYQYSMFSSPPTNTGSIYGVSPSTASAQSSDKEPETPIGSMSEFQVPAFSTQVGLENITLDDGGNTTQKRSRARFSREEDTLLIQAWLNVSKDSIVGVDQKADSFWLRIKDNYNEHRNDLRERQMMQLKCRWHRLNNIVQKFAGCYKQAVQRKKSGSSESDIMEEAYKIFCQDEGEQFKLEYAWRLLKDEPKWMGESYGCSSKRTKISASGAYSSSSNPETPTNSEYDPDSPIMVRPIGQKAAKRSGKAKASETSSIKVDLSSLETALEKKADAMTKLAIAKEEENEIKKTKLMLEEMKILATDTSDMPERRRRDHEAFCDIIRKKYGIM